MNRKANATAIIGLLRAKSDHPVTTGVHGNWGAGKHSMLEMIDAETLLSQAFEREAKPLKTARFSFALATSFHTDREEEHGAI